MISPTTYVQETPQPYYSVLHEEVGEGVKDDGLSRWSRRDSTGKTEIMKLVRIQTNYAARRVSGAHARSAPMQSASIL